MGFDIARLIGRTVDKVVQTFRMHGSIADSIRNTYILFEGKQIGDSFLLPFAIEIYYHKFRDMEEISIRELRVGEREEIFKENKDEDECWCYSPNSDIVCPSCRQK